MGTSIAIDLGTTNCVVATLGQFPEAGRVIRDVTVIQDERGNVTFPSVVAHAAERNPPFIVGHVAKQRIRLRKPTEPSPIAFVKRYMGSEKQFSLGSESMFLPEQISGKILYFLIDLAERRLNTVVDRVLITVPAHFGHHETRLTQEAASLHANAIRKEFGKPPVTVIGVLKEPIAAAYAYGVQDQRSNLRVLVYDLGGGTFDVSILEKRNDAVSVIDFGGDRQLGGHNFDRLIANRLLSELAKNYELDLDPEASDGGNDEDESRYAKLLDIAERAKIKVSGSPESVCEIHESDIFVDKSANAAPVNIEVREFSHEELCELVNGYLNETVELMWSLLDRSQLNPSQIDEVLLVGGSTKLSRIAEKLAFRPSGLKTPPAGYDKGSKIAEHWRGGLGKQPRLFSPDLAVAIGAAYYTHQGGFETTSEAIRIKQLPVSTPFPKVVVEGSSQSAAAQMLVVRRQDGAVFEGKLQDGNFRLPVDLLENRRNRLDIALQDAAKNVIASHSVIIAHELEGAETQEPSAVALTAFLSHDLWLDLAEGPTLIAKRGEVLPKEFVEQMSTLHRAQSIVLHLFEGRIKRLADLSIPARQDFVVPAGHPIELRGRIGEDERIVCEVSTIVDDKEHRREVAVRYKPSIVRPRSALIEATKSLLEKYEQTMHGLDPNDRADHAGAILERIEECDEELARPMPDGLRIEQILLDAEAILLELGQLATWKAQRDTLLQELAEGKRLCRGDLMLNAEIARLERRADEAFQEKDARDWSTIRNDVARTLRGLRELQNHRVTYSAETTKLGAEPIALETAVTRRGTP